MYFIPCKHVLLRKNFIRGIKNCCYASRMSVNTRKDLISIHNTKYQLPCVILYLNADVGGLSIRSKIKKEKISK